MTIKMSRIQTTPVSMPRRAGPWPLIVSVEAAIGSGKSSLLKVLEGTIGAGGGWVVVQELVDQWRCIGGQHNLLEAYYTDQERHAFSFQVNCVLSRIKSLQEALNAAPESAEVVILERCWHSDRNTFGLMLHETGKISDLEWAVYEDYYQFATESAPAVDGHIYLVAGTETCMDRLRRRNRSEEAGVTADYQARLVQCHEDWLRKLPEDKVCRINVDEEFIKDQANADRIVQKIGEFIKHLVRSKSGIDVGGANSPRK
jgi:deoxyadenosine/deoxycytidine kinase